MALAERAELVARLSLDNRNFLANARGSVGALKNMEGSLGRIAGHAKRGLSTAATNLAKIGAVATGFVAFNVKAGISSLAELEDAVTSVDGAIKQVGLTGRITGQQVAAWANEIETDVERAFDDKEITQAATTLIRFGKVTQENLRPAMVVMTDLATKTGDVGSASSLLAKALADPEKAAGKLARTGVVLTKVTQDQIKELVAAGKVGEAQALILTELEKATLGAAKASAGPYRDSLNILKDVTEDAQRALGEAFLPLLSRVADKLSTALADPKVIADIKGFGQTLAGGFDKLLQVAGNIPWKQIGDSLKIAGAGAKALFDAFTMMPPWVQTAVLTGWGLNKLTGGALGAIVGELGKGLIKGVLGINAGVVNVKGAVVNGAGGVPVAGAAAKGGLGVLSRLFLVGEAVGLVAAVIGVQQAISTENTKLGNEIHNSLNESLKNPQTPKDLAMKLGAIDASLKNFKENPALALVAGNSLQELIDMRAQVVAAIAAQGRTIVGGLSPEERDTKRAIDRGTDATESMATAIAAELGQTRGAIVGALGRSARVKGPVKSVEKLTEIGEKGDPFGFKHLKAFALGKIAPGIQNAELVRHIDLVKDEIRDAKQHGDPETVAKLQETKEGLQTILRDVKAGTFKAGHDTYQGLLGVVAAVNALPPPKVVVNLPGSPDDRNSPKLPKNASGSPDDRDKHDPTKPQKVTPGPGSPTERDERNTQAKIDRTRNAVEANRIALQSIPQKITGPARNDTDRIVAGLNRVVAATKGLSVKVNVSGSPDDRDRSNGGKNMRRSRENLSDYRDQ